MNVKFYKIGNEFARVKKPFIKKIKKIFSSGKFILGKSNKKFEKKISTLLKVKYVVGVGNGSDALEIGLLAAGIKKGDEVNCNSYGFHLLMQYLMLGPYQSCRC